MPATVVERLKREHSVEVAATMKHFALHALVAVSKSPMKMGVERLSIAAVEVERPPQDCSVAANEAAVAEKQARKYFAPPMTAVAERLHSDLMDDVDSSIV